MSTTETKQQAPRSRRIRRPSKMVRQQSCRGRTVISFAVLMLIVSGCQGHDGGGDAPEPGQYQTNSDGLTYGSAVDAPSTGEEPDLISVYATNGEMGYVFRSDLDGPEPQTPEEAAATQTERNQAEVAAAYSVLSSEFGVEIDSTAVSPTDALDAIEPIWASLYERIDGDACLTSVVTLLDLAGSSVPADEVEAQAISGELCASMTAAAAATSSRMIPVYESDGKTVVGEFRIGR